MKKFNVKSPTRDENYSVEDGLQKFTGRRNYDLQGEITQVRLVECYQWNADNDGDFVFPFVVTTAPSLWCESADFKLRGMFDMHCSGAGKWNLGHFSEADMDNPPVENIETHPDDDVYEMECKLGDKQDTIKFKFEDLTEAGQTNLRLLLSELPVQFLGDDLRNAFNSKQEANSKD